VHLQPGQRYRRECLVHLEQVEVADLHAAALEQPSRRLHRSVEVEVRLGTDETLRDDARPRSQPECRGLLGVHEQHGRRTVGDL
jgi:hypothetical protein